jgi:hypothetical protein
MHLLGKQSGTNRGSGAGWNDFSIWMAILCASNFVTDDNGQAAVMIFSPKIRAKDPDCDWLDERGPNFDGIFFLSRILEGLGVWGLEPRSGLLFNQLFVCVKRLAVLTFPDPQV